MLLERVALSKHGQAPRPNLQSKLKLSFYLAEVNWVIKLIYHLRLYQMRVDKIMAERLVSLQTEPTPGCIFCLHFLQIRRLLVFRYV